jgi:signal transduction histidine kinase
VAIGLIATVALRAAASEEDVVSSDSPYLLFSADLVISESRTPPPDDAAWQRVELPDTWRLHERYREGTSAWYRFRLPDQAPQEPYAVYLWRFSMNVEAYFNGEQIGSGGSFDEPIARNWNRPFLWSLPQATWRDSNNLLYVHLRIYPGFGNFTPPALGPERELEPEYRARYFRQITLSEYAFIVTLVVAIIGLVFWFADRRDPSYLLFVVASLAWSVYGLNQFVQNIPMSAKTWWWLVHTAVDIGGTMMLLFVHRLLRARRVLIDALALAVIVAASICYAVWDLPTFARYNNYWHAITFMFPAYATVYAVWRAVRHRDPDSIYLSLCLLVLLVMGLHDLILNSLALPRLWASRFYLTQLGAPMMLVLLVIYMARRLAAAFNETRSANVRLEARVNEVTRALEENYRRRQLLERDRVMAAERERIYQDLHDDVGAKLLSLVYASENDKQADLARDALREMRSIVASDALEGGELRYAAADWRAEAERRCEQAGCTLEWEEQVDDARLTGMQRYHVERILRELVSNALQHSGGTRVRAAVHSMAGQLSLVVEDNGHGFLGAEPPASHGLLGIRRRVTALEGHVEWRTSAQGVCCRVEVPLPPSGGSDPPSSFGTVTVDDDA